MPGPLINLTYQDRQLIQHLARQRASTKAGMAYQGETGPQTKTEIHESGLRGEVAFARHFDLQVDREKRADGDRWDFCFPNGLTVDVKHRGQPKKDLAMKGDTVKELRADTAVLTWEEAQGIRIVGWTTPVRLLLAGKRSHWTGVGKKLWISHDDLWCVDKLPTQK